MKKGTVYAISVNAERGKLKQEVPEATVIENFGIEQDGHAGDWGRQVTCLDYNSLKKSNQEHHLNMGPGDFAENILIDGLDLSKVVPGNRLKFASGVVLEVTQAGKKDHPSVVTKTFGVSLLPYEGLFCKVISGGTLKKGDWVELL